MNNYGDECWELDAMDPNDLRDRVKEEIEARIDWDAWDLALKSEEAEKASIKNILDQWKRAVGKRDE